MAASSVEPTSGQSWEERRGQRIQVPRSQGHDAKVGCAECGPRRGFEGMSAVPRLMKERRLPALFSVSSLVSWSLLSFFAFFSASLLSDPCTPRFAPAGSRYRDHRGSVPGQDIVEFRGAIAAERDKVWCSQSRLGKRREGSMWREGRRAL